MKKTFVLDTNVILQTPYAVYYFDEHDVVIPDVVLEELDKFKKEKSDLGANAREAARLLDELRNNGNLADGVELPGGGTLRVVLNYIDVQIPTNWDISKNDNRILRVCKGLNDEGKNVYLVTKDIFQRIKSEIIGISAQDFFAEQVPKYTEQYKGVIKVFTKDENINRLYKNGWLEPDKVYILNDESKELEYKLTTNEFLLLQSNYNVKHTALGRYDGEKIVQLKYLYDRPFGVIPRSINQKFLQEALMMDADKIPLVIIKGPAGTAKTFYSLAVGLHKIIVEENQMYRKILVCRPNVKMDEDIGFLPGTEEEKIAPFMRPVIDNLEILMNMDLKRRFNDSIDPNYHIKELFENNIISTEAIAFIRGRSIVNQWVLIDEAQNLTPRQVKGIITRAGNGTKIILVGDPAQIDHPFLDSRTNGLCYAAEKMKGSPLCMQITLSDEDCERSELAYESSKRM